MKILFVNVAPIIIYGLGPAFSDLGHQVKYINIDLDQSLAKAVDEFHPDFVFNDGGIDRMQKLFPFLSYKKIPHVYWAIEDPTFYQLSLPYAERSSLVFTPCKESITEYSRHDIKAQLLMFACHPRYHRQVTPDIRYKHDIVFIGNNYDYHMARREGLNNIIKPALKNFDIKIYGNEWWLDTSKTFYISSENYGGYLPNESIPAVCASSKIILGIHSTTNSETMMSMRTFEILGSAGFFLTQWTKSIQNLFKNHYHLVWSKSEDETVDLIKFYMAHPELRKKIAKQGQAEVYEKHTYHIRIKTFESILKQVSDMAANMKDERFINIDTITRYKTQKAYVIRMCHKNWE